MAWSNFATHLLDFPSAQKRPSGAALYRSLEGVVEGVAFLGWQNAGKRPTYRPRLFCSLWRLDRYKHDHLNKRKLGRQISDPYSIHGRKETISSTLQVIFNQHHHGLGLTSFINISKIKPVNNPTIPYLSPKMAPSNFPRFRVIGRQREIQRSMHQKEKRQRWGCEEVFPDHLSIGFAHSDIIVYVGYIKNVYPARWELYGTILDLYRAKEVAIWGFHQQTTCWFGDDWSP